MKSKEADYIEEKIKCSRPHGLSHLISLSYQKQWKLSMMNKVKYNYG